MLIRNAHAVKNKINKLMRENIIALIHKNPGISLSDISTLLPELIFEKLHSENSDDKLVVIEEVKHAFLAVNFLVSKGKIIKIEYKVPTTEGIVNLVMLFPWGTTLEVTGILNPENSEPTLYT